MGIFPGASCGSRRVRPAMSLSARSHATTIFEDGKQELKNGNYAAAAEAFTTSFNLSVPKQNTKLTAVSLKMMGDIYRLLKKPANALRCFIEVEPMFVSLWGEQSKNYAGLLYGMADAHRHLGAFKPAKELLKRRLAIVEHVWGKGHEYGSVLQELGTLELSAGEYKSALHSLEKAMQLENHQTNDYAVLLSDLSLTLVALEDYRRALDFRLQQVALIKVLKADNHPEYASALHNGAALHLRMGNPSQAIDFETRALRIFEEKLGPDDPRTVAARGQLEQMKE